MAKCKAGAGSPRKGTGPAPRATAVTIKLSPQEYQLISYAASRSRARGVQGWIRERLLDAAREKVSEKTAADIIEGRATAALLEESLQQARTPGSSRGGRVLEFGGRKNHEN